MSCHFCEGKTTEDEIRQLQDDIEDNESDFKYARVAAWIGLPLLIAFTIYAVYRGLTDPPQIRQSDGTERSSDWALAAFFFVLFSVAGMGVYLNKERLFRKEMRHDRRELTRLQIEQAGL